MKQSKKVVILFLFSCFSTFALLGHYSSIIHNYSFHDYEINCIIQRRSSHPFKTSLNPQNL